MKTMATVCQKCGVKGFEELLIFCKKCQTSAEHRYCLDKMPKLPETEVHWLCEQCRMKDRKVDTSNNISVKRKKKWDTRHHRHRSSHADLVQRIKYRPLQDTCIVQRSSNLDKPPNQTSHCLEKDMLNVATTPKESKSINTEQGDLLLISEKNGTHPEKENGKNLCNDVEGRKMRRRKLILDGDSDVDAPSLTPVTDDVPYKSTTRMDKPFTPLSLPQNCASTIAQADKILTEFDAECCGCLPVSPIVLPAWRGYFNTSDGNLGPVVAHLSNRACEKVCDMVNMLPQILHFERLPKLEAWPKSFNRSAPTDDNIALYFFPIDFRVKEVLQQLMDDVIKKDLVLKVIVGVAELLVFSSMLLPEQCHLFKGEHYLWGVFRPRQAPRVRTTPDIHCSSLSEEAAGPVDKHQHYEVFKDVPANLYSRLNAVDGKEDDNPFRELHAQSPRVPDDEFITRSEKTPVCEVPGEHPSRSNDALEEHAGESEDALVRDETSRPCLPPDKSCDFTGVTGESDVENYDGSVEFNFSGECGGGADGSLAACLKLFPLEVEDLGVTAKVQGSGEVDLELGLETAKERRNECKPAVEGQVVFLFGRAIF